MPDGSTLNSRSDQQLVADTLAGDKERFGALVDRYWNMAVALALSKLTDPSNAEDVAQESFLHAYMMLYTLRDGSRFPGWFSKIVTQKCVDCNRKRAREKFVSTSEVPELESLQPPLTAENPGLTDEGREFVRKGIERLPEKFREVVIMRFVANLSTPEIARQLGKRPGTVRVWLHRAYQMLRKDLAPLAEEVKEL